jgi:hypothetical protein
MIVVLAIDALEYEKVEQFNCLNLKQKFYGKTNISEFSQPRTMVLWSSFSTGKNKEKEVLIDGDKEMWGKTWDIKETFFSNFKRPKIIDLPGFSYEQDIHEKSRTLLKKFFETKDQEQRNKILSEYNQDAFAHHKKIKSDFFEALNSGKHDFILGYFSVIDVIGHLNFGNTTMMKMLYKDVDEIASKIAKIPDVKLLVLSDHGMYLLGKNYGDHSNYGFWSYNQNLSNPKITDFASILTNR